ALVAEDAVGDVAAEDRRGVDQREVGAVDAVGRRFADRVAAVELRDDVQHERPADAVEGEALPEFGHEQHPQRLGMTHALRGLGNGRLALGRYRGSAHAVSPVVWKLNENPTPTARAGEIYRHRGAASNVREGAQILLQRNICARNRLNGEDFCAPAAGKSAFW